jgi:hypothetical protein
MSVFRHPIRFVLLGVMLALIVGVTPAFAGPVVTDSYLPPSNASGDGWVLNTTFPQVAQSFTASVGGTLDSATFWMSKYNYVPTGPVYAELYAITGTYGLDSVPIGPPLATSAAVDAATLSATWPAYAPTTFVFDNTFSLAAGTRYAIALRFAGTGPGGGVWVADFWDTAALGHSGNNSGTWGDGSWKPGQSEGYADTDNYFEVYVNETAPPIVSTPASSPWSLALIAGLGLVAVRVIRRTRAAA